MLTVLLKEFQKTHCILDPYKVEVFKGCWHAKLRALKAENDGELPDDKVAELYANYKCKFGCPPPRTPASVFVDMFEVPRPKMTGAGKYDSFEATYGTPTPLDLPPLKPGATKEIAPPGVFEKDKVQGTIPCVSCARMRCVYVKTKLSPTSMAILLEALEVNKSSYSCVPNANNHQDRASAGRKRMVEDSSEEDEGFSAEEEELLQEDCDEPDEPEFFLKTVHDVRLSGRRLEYLVEWEDWPNVEDFTWEPTAHLPGHKDLLHEFKSKWISEGKPWPRT
ncbi:hypothetical protein AB1Y20_004039 [Prymnesium parvum]|uniref:Chromo domain-containing protein n=1 Tax=Prymnesium parvum TaxID=97485 RepID=A0AB34J6E8_PRYPA